MLSLGESDPLSVRCLETRVSNGKDKPASRLENPSYSLKDRLEVRDIYQSHDTDTASKTAVAQLISALSISLKIENTQPLLLFIASR